MRNEIRVLFAKEEDRKVFQQIKKLANENERTLMAQTLFMLKQSLKQQKLIK